VAKLVRSSHERWDGAGYPDGLAGEAIPLGSRIIFVCDAFDAMLADRPYSAPLAFDPALTELERCAGGQFDPRVVAAFVTVTRRRAASPLDAAAR
jgi:HD-GYP domain-containing protein (c-di-GMP phosphodiesterase class II)